jgi:hypothetical protein
VAKHVPLCPKSITVGNEVHTFSLLKIDLDSDDVTDQCETSEKKPLNSNEWVIS